MLPDRTKKSTVIPCYRPPGSMSRKGLFGDQRGLMVRLTASERMGVMICPPTISPRDRVGRDR